MNDFVIITDSCHDLPVGMAQELQVAVAPLSVEYDERTVFDDGFMDPHEFYNGIRGGRMPKTAAVNPEQWREKMEPALKAGKDVLALCFSSNLSTTHQSAVIAAQELREQYPQRKILVADTLSASIGHGLLVWNAAGMRDAGASLEEVHSWVLENRLHVCHWVTVNDLMHLKRGGRVSAATAVVGTMLQIKPVLIMNDEGKLDTVAKARGRKAAMSILAQKLEETGLDGQNETVFIGHGDCPEDAQALAELVKGHRGVKNVIISHVGNVIGSHTGPDVLVVAFLGTNRRGE